MEDFENKQCNGFKYLALYNCSILLLIIVFNLLLCLKYMLNFITGMYVGGKSHTIYVGLLGAAIPGLTQGLDSEYIPQGDEFWLHCKHRPACTAGLTANSTKMQAA